MNNLGNVVSDLLLCSISLVICFHERVLVEELLAHYHTGLRPIIANSSQPTSVNISIRLVQIFDMVSTIVTYSVQRATF